jgi:hypothetical protein
MHSTITSEDHLIFRSFVLREPYVDPGLYALRIFAGAANASRYEQLFQLMF